MFWIRGGISRVGSARWYLAIAFLDSDSDHVCSILDPGAGADRSRSSIVVEVGVGGTKASAPMFGVIWSNNTARSVVVR